MQAFFAGGQPHEQANVTCVTGHWRSHWRLGPERARRIVENRPFDSWEDGRRSIAHTCQRHRSHLGPPRRRTWRPHNHGNRRGV